MGELFKIVVKLKIQTERLHLSTLLCFYVNTSTGRKGTVTNPETRAAFDALEEVTNEFTSSVGIAPEVHC